MSRKIVWFLLSAERVPVEEMEIPSLFPKPFSSSSFYPRPFCHLKLSCWESSSLPCFRVNSDEIELEKEELETSVDSGS